MDPVIQVFGQTFKTKKQFILYIRGLEARSLKLRSIVDAWNGEGDLIIDDTAVRVDDIEFDNLSAATIEAVWIDHTESEQRQQAERIVQMEQASAAQIAETRSALKNLIREVLAEGDGRVEDGSK
jgi:hypothetical protein